MDLYDAYREGRDNPLPPLPVQYADFALWQQKWLKGGARDEGLRYWTQQLSGIPERLDLPTDYSRPSVQSFEAQACQTSLTAITTAAIKKLAQEHRSTLYMVLLSAFGILLWRYSGQDDLVVGSPSANRPHPELEQLIGLFVNTLVMRLRLRGSMTVLEVLAQVRKTALSAYQHQDVPFETIVEALRPQRRLDISPIVQVVLALQNAPWSSQQLRGLHVDALTPPELRVRVDLELHAREQQGQLVLEWLYKRGLFDRWRIEQMARHLSCILHAVTADLLQPIGDIELLTSSERRLMIEEWNTTSSELPKATVPELFEEQVERTPEAVAVISKDHKLTYRELNSHANRLAHLLIGRNIRPERRVGVCLDRDSDIIVALLAVLKSGAVYLPLDPAYPQERLRFIIEDAQPDCILTKTATSLGDVTSRTLIFLDDINVLGNLAKQSTSNPTDYHRASPLLPKNAVYAIYTSGSTGVPKGVTVHHESLVSKIVDLIRYFRIDETVRFGATSSISFDSSIEQILCGVCGGGASVIVSGATGPDRYSFGMQGTAVSMLNLVPAVAEYLLSGATGIYLQALIVGGDTLSPEFATRLYEARIADRLLNLYGPTEICIDACCD